MVESQYAKHVIGASIEAAMPVVFSAILNHLKLGNVLVVVKRCKTGVDLEAGWRKDFSNIEEKFTTG